jgi:SPP1 gp7 family putative phage head morphogenesis protein
MAIGQHYAGGSGCGHEHPTPTIRAINLSTWTKAIDKIAKELFTGKRQALDLDDTIITKTYGELKEGVGLGFGATFGKATQKPFLLNNLFNFSVAKTYQQMAEMQDFLVDDEGKLRSFTSFKAKVDTVHEKYNSRYLEVEYNTAKRSGQAARQWQEIQADKDLFPNLIYRTVGDARVRKAHQDLEGITKPVEDAFWDVYYPPNDHGCRCGVKSTESKATGKVNAKPINEAFRNNVGKTNQVFTDKHPYFNMDQKAKKVVDKKADGNKK